MDYWGEKILLPHCVGEGQAVNCEVWMTRVREPQAAVPLSLWLSCRAWARVRLAMPGKDVRRDKALARALLACGRSDPLRPSSAAHASGLQTVGKELSEVGSGQTQMPAFPGVLQTNDHVLAEIRFHSCPKPAS